MGSNEMILPFMRYLREWFDFPSTETFCQVATVSNLSPSLRTMRLFEARDDALVFLTRTETKKWHDLSLNPLVAVHLVNPARGQIVINGTAASHTRNTNQLLVDLYWLSLPTHLRAIYTLSHQNNDAPVNFGAITVSPQSYDFLKIHRDDYLKSTRTLYFRDGETWRQKPAVVS